MALECPIAKVQVKNGGKKSPFDWPSCFVCLCGFWWRDILVRCIYTAAGGRDCLLSAPREQQQVTGSPEKQHTFRCVYWWPVRCSTTMWRGPTWSTFIGGNTFMKAVIGDTLCAAYTYNLIGCHQSSLLINILRWPRAFFQNSWRAYLWGGSRSRLKNWSFQQYLAVQQVLYSSTFWLYRSL